MHELKLRRAEKHELTENVWDSHDMRETWQGCLSFHSLANTSVVVIVILWLICQY